MDVQVCSNALLDLGLAVPMQMYTQRFFHRKIDNMNGLKRIGFSFTM